jgi:hypothetical protein
VLAERLARATRAQPDVIHTLVTVADNDQKLGNIATVYVRLTDPVARSRTQNEIMDRVRKEVLPLAPADAKVSVELVNDFSLGGQRNAMIQYLITGPDLDRLRVYAERILAKMKTVPGVVDLDSSAPAPLPERTLLPNLDHAAALGVDPGDLTSTLGVLMGGVEAPGDEELGSRYVVYLRANERFRTDPSLLGLITVPSRTLGLVPLTDVVTQAEGTGPSQITRTARAKSITIIANVAPGHAEGEIVAALDAAIKELNLPPGYTAGPFGRSKEMARTGKAFMFAFLLSFLFMYLVLAAQFESWLHPLIDHAGAAADDAVRVPVGGAVQGPAQHLLDAGPPGLVRRRQEERDPPDRPRHPAAGQGPGPRRRDRRRRPRPLAADPDDDVRVRRRHDAAGAEQGHRRRLLEGHRRHRRRRPDLLAGADADRHPGVLLAVRRPRRAGRARQALGAAQRVPDAAAARPRPGRDRAAGRTGADGARRPRRRCDRGTPADTLTPSCAG